METKQKHLKKIKVYESGEEFQFEFEGIGLNSNIDEKKINELIEDFVNNSNHKNMVGNIAFLRTILRDYDEGMLNVSYTDANGNTEKVSYINKTLISYKSYQKNKLTMYATYEEQNGLQVTFNNNEENVIEYSKVDFNEYFSNLIEHIKDLSNVKALIMDDIEKSFEYIICTPNEVETTLKLIKKINNELNSND